MSRVCGTFKEREGWHGCQMPIGVLNRIISASSNENDVVLDPFNGSGTTVVAAALLIGFALARVAGSYITDVDLPGVLPIAGAAAVLVGAAALASLIPAARASRVDVIEALRSE